MIKEFLKKSYITESTKYVAIYGSIYYFNERMEDNGINLVIKLGSKTINTISNTIKYFKILYTKKETVVSQKGAMNCSVIDRIHITGMQNFDKSKKLNPVEIKIDGNQILKILQRYQKDYKFRYILNVLLFSSGITNKANVLFITCNVSINAHYSLINGKSMKTLGIIHLNQIRNWDIVKDESKWINTTLTGSDYPLNADHFAVCFDTTASNDLLHFSFSFINKKVEIVTFKTGEEKGPSTELQNSNLQKIKVLEKSKAAV